jgi:large subunit ribosomal protein L32
MRVTKGHTGNRRSHHALSDIRLSDCPNCQAKHERHKLCLACGFYKGNQIMEIRKKSNLVKTVEDVQKTENNDSKKIELESDTKGVANAPKAKVMKKVQNKG